MLLQDLSLLGFAILGTLFGAVIALVPGLHAFNIAGLALLLSTNNQLPAVITDQALALFLVGLVVGWVVLNTIPTVFLFAPDEASAFAVLPATKMLLQGRGAEATLLIGAGSVAGLIGLVALAPFLQDLLRPVRSIIQPHLGWILIAILTFLILGEWPRTDNRAPTPLRRLLAAWVYLGAALLTFTLSGLMGFVLMYRSPIPITASFQNLLPAFVGLFVIPGLLQMLLFGGPIPKQQPATATLNNLHPYELTRGTLTGIVGGLFASVLPVISGGVGGLLAGHATSKYDDRLFLISQGANKVAYYIGSTLLLFVPGVALVRGGLSWMLSSIYVPTGTHMYWLVVGAVGLCGALALVLLMALTRVATAAVSHINAKALVTPALVIAVCIAFGFTGLGGVVVLLVGTCIGLIPILVGGRRMNCLGIILLPITLNMIGIGPAVAQWLGLL